MDAPRTVTVGNIAIGNDRPLALIAGPCQLESRAHAREMCQALVEITGNATLLATYRRLVNELHLYRRETLEHGPDSFPTSTHEHLAIVEAVARGDAEKASRLLHDHAMESRERLHRTLDRPKAEPPRNAAAKRRKA